MLIFERLVLQHTIGTAQPESTGMVQLQQDPTASLDWASKQTSVVMQKTKAAQRAHSAQVNGAKEWKWLSALARTYAVSLFVCLKLSSHA